MSSSSSLSSSPVSAFYAGQTVFVTGGTGFLGKVLVYKLLHTCPDLARVYLLIRERKGQTAGQRLHDLLQTPPFDPVRRDNPAALDKVRAVSGDITLPGLGLSDADERMLADSVGIVFHSAATVKFDEDLTESVAMNIGGTESMLALAKKMRRLQSFVHVSTAYCHCYLRQTIGEQLYPLQTTPRAMMSLCRDRSSTPEQKAALNSPAETRRWIGQWPNTYTFTKALAEQLLQDERADLPIVIIRPSIVIGSWREPMPGWIDNFNGPTGMIAGASTGILRTFWLKDNLKADVIPVDVVINMMCVLAYHVAANEGQVGAASTNQIQVFNCTSGGPNPITWGRIKHIMMPYFSEYPMEKLLWYPGGTFKSNWYHDQLAQLFVHQLPAYLFDLVLLLLPGGKPFLVRLHKRITKATEALTYFTTHEWTWSNDNVRTLRQTIARESPGDLARFDFDLTTLDWREYMLNYVLGTRRYVLKHDPSTLDASRRHITKLWYVDCLAKALLAAAAACLLACLLGWW